MNVFIIIALAYVFIIVLHGQFYIRRYLGQTRKDIYQS